MAYVDSFGLLGFMSLICVPIILLFQGVRREPRKGITVEE
jgi:hypothetical protein